MAHFIDGALRFDRVLLIVVAVTVLVPAPFSAQSIADAARQERARRQQLSKNDRSVVSPDGKSPVPATVVPPNVSTPPQEASAPPSTPAAPAQIVDVPTAYSMTMDNSALAPGLITKIYRSGTKAAIGQTMLGLQRHTVYDLSTRRSYTWSLLDRSVPCTSGSFSDDWGDPFVAAAHLKADILKENARQTGTATINGIETRVIKVQQYPDEATLWLEQKSGLIIKAEARVNGQRKPMIEVKQLSFSPPPENLFNLPASCQGR
jgi:hypothetical protein